MRRSDGAGRNRGDALRLALDRCHQNREGKWDRGAETLQACFKSSISLVASA
jgi:hypothetical protein